MEICLKLRTVPFILMPFSEELGVGGAVHSPVYFEPVLIRMCVRSPGHPALYSEDFRKGKDSKYLDLVATYGLQRTFFILL